MSNVRQSLTAKVRISKKASFLNRTAVILDCRVFVDHAFNIILQGETEKARKTFDVLKAMGYVTRRSAEMSMSDGSSYMFLNA